MIEKIILKKSAVLDKMPNTEQLDFGELAINYNAAHPFLSFKDSDGNITALNDYADAIKKKLNISDFNAFKADNTNTINVLDRNVSQNSSEIQEVNGIVQNHTDAIATLNTSIAQKADKTDIDTINANVDQKVGKTDITQSTGESTTAVMSQKAVSDALSNVYTKAESDAMLATKQNVLTAGNGITIEDDVISVDNKKFTVWSNPRIDEYVTTFENFGYNDDGTQKTSGSSVRSWVFRIGNYGHKKVFLSLLNSWICDGLDDAQNMVNPTLFGKSEGNTYIEPVDITEEHIGKYIVAMSVGSVENKLGTDYCRCVMFCDEKTQAELDADERMLSDMYAGNLMRYAVSTSSISDTPTLEWGKGVELSTNCLRNIFLDIVSRPNIAYECKVVNKLDFLYQGCGRLIEITPLWDTSLVTTMRSAFNNCRALERADLSHLNLSSVTDVSYMFNMCIVLREAKIPSLPSVINCTNMFYGCSSLQSMTLPELSSVTNCFQMFRNCSSLQSIALPELPSVTNCYYMFYACSSLQSVILSELPSVSTCIGMFSNCYSLQRVTLPSLPSVKSCVNMFINCSSLQSVTLPELSSVTNCASMFRNCSSLQSLYIDTPNCIDFTHFATNCTSLHTIEIVDVRKAQSLTNSFNQCYSLQNVTCVEELPKRGISFSSSSKLTSESVTNIITHLPDLSAEGSKTLTLHPTTKSLLTESLIAEATNKNWIIA